MSIKEAIIVLNTMRIGGCKTEKEAIDMAVEVLELADSDPTEEKGK